MEKQEYEAEHAEEAIADPVPPDESSELTEERALETEDSVEGSAEPMAEDSLEDSVTKEGEALQVPAESQDPAELSTVEPEPSVPGFESPVAAAGIMIKRSHLIIGAIVAVALIVGGFFLGFYLSGNGDGGLFVDPNAQDYGNIQGIPGNTNTDGISIPGYSKVVFPADERDVKMVLLNPEGNPCYFRFTLILSQTGEELVKTNLVPPGMAVTDLTLSRKLETGEYELEILIESFSLDQSFAPMNGAKVSTVLYVR